jgi:hypothetical protein
MVTTPVYPFKLREEDRSSSFIKQQEKYARTDILTRLFDTQSFLDEPGLVLDFKQDIREECGKFGLRRVRYLRLIQMGL